MSIQFACSCGKAYDVRDDLAGRRVRCKECGSTFDVPEPTPEPEPTAPMPKPAPKKPDWWEVLNAPVAMPWDMPAPAPGPKPSPWVVRPSPDDGGASAGPPPPDPAPSLARFEYKMVQIPPTISIKEGVPFGRRAADYLEDIVNRTAAKGWDFYRIDTVGIQVEPGCLGALLGQRVQTVEFFVVSFRRPVDP